MEGEECPRMCQPAASRLGSLCQEGKGSKQDSFANKEERASEQRLVHQDGALKEAWCTGGQGLIVCKGEGAIGDRG